jgi:glycosyltransferase involved in cell wall biosynthesis
MNIELSVIAPLYNEEDSIRPLHQTIEDVLSKTSLNYEIIFIDDGSKDKTVAIGKELVEKNPRLRFVEFRKNYGQTAAMSDTIVKISS